MSRSGKIKRLATLPDPVYQSRILAKFINKTMKDGKKEAAYTQVYRAMELLGEKFPGEEPAKIFEEIITAVAPKMEVRSRRVGGASYMVPAEVRGERKLHLAMRWLLDAARAKNNKEFKTFAEKLVSELVDARAGTGNALKKRDQVHKMAEANKAFSHLRW